MILETLILLAFLQPLDANSYKERNSFHEFIKPHTDTLLPYLLINERCNRSAEARKRSTILVNEWYTVNAYRVAASLTNVVPIRFMDFRTLDDFKNHYNQLAINAIRSWTGHFGVYYRMWQDYNYAVGTTATRLMLTDLISARHPFERILIDMRTEYENHKEDN